MIDFRTQWEANVLRFSTAAVWHQGGQPLALRAAFAVPRDTDDQFVNALGLGVRIITIRAIDTAGREPRTLDRIEIAGEELTINAATPVVVDGAVIGWRCMAQGQGPGP